MNLLKLLHRFVKTVTSVSRPLPNQTKLKCDQDFSKLLQWFIKAFKLMCQNYYMHFLPSANSNQTEIWPIFLYVLRRCWLIFQLLNWIKQSTPGSIVPRAMFFFIDSSRHLTIFLQDIMLPGVSARGLGLVLDFLYTGKWGFSLRLLMMILQV